MNKKQDNTRATKLITITTIFDRQETRLLQIAAEAYSAMLDKTDHLHPDPEMRENAEKLLDLAALLQSANVNRQFIEGAK